MKPLTEAQKRLIQLDLMEPGIKAFYEERDAVIAQIVAESGLDSHFQAEDGIVFQVVKAKGKYVTFKEVDYVRTRKKFSRSRNFKESSKSCKIRATSGSTCR